MVGSSIPDAFCSDLLDRKIFSARLESFILKECQFVEGSLVVSLDGPFGSGKSTFLQMWSSDLAERRKQDSNLPLPVTINAWESDYCGDALVAIVSALTVALADQTKSALVTSQAECIREAAKDVLWFGLALANNWTSTVTGVDPIAAAEFAAGKKEARRASADQSQEVLSLFEQRRHALKKLKEALDDAFGDGRARAVVLIDELDRCRPDYAISYLEAIKHIFDVHGIVFVIAIDERQLSSAVGTLFGPGLNFPEYYRKFSHRTIRLPEPDSASVARLVRDYCSRYLFRDSVRESVLRADYREPSNRQIVLLWSAFNLGPRQLQEAFRIVGHAAEGVPGRRQEIFAWAFEVSVLFMAGLRAANPRAYKKFGMEDVTPSEIRSVLNALSGELDRDWWFKILAAGLSRNAAVDKLIAHELAKAEQTTSGQGQAIDVSKALAEFGKGWLKRPADDSGLVRVYTHIESLGSFAQ